MKRLRFGVALGAALAWTSLSAAAETAPPQAVRPLEIRDAVLASSFHVQGRMSISADSSTLAYVACDPRRAKVDPKDKNAKFATRGSAYRSMGCDVWTVALADGKSTNRTEAKGNSWGPVWSPDGRSLVYFSDRGGRPQLWSFEPASGRTRLVSPAETRTFFGFEVPVWTPDSKRLFVRLRPEGMTDAELEDDAPPAPASGEGGDDKEPGSTVVVYRSKRPEEGKPANSVSANLPAQISLGDLSEIDVATGRVRRLLPHHHTEGFWVSPDGSRLAVLEMKGRRSAAALNWTYDLTVVDLASGRSHVAATGVEQSFGTAVSWSPDGRWLAYFSGEAYQMPDCFVVGSADGATRKLEREKAEKPGKAAARQTPALGGTEFLAPLWDADSKTVTFVGENRVWRGDVAAGRLAALTPDLGAKVYEIVQTPSGDRPWSPDGKAFYFSRRDDRTKRGQFWKVDVATGKTSLVLDEPKSFGRVFETPLVSPDGRRVVYLSQSVSESEDLWAAGVDFHEPRRLTEINPQLSKYRFGKSRLLDFTNADGKALHASLLLPSDYEEGKRYPTLVFVYPQDWGSETVHQFGLGGLAAYNLHMLTTRGYAVLQPDIPVGKGSIMRDLMKSVMPAIDRAVELGVVDPDRLALTGQSAGGYATIAILTQTTRFKAAIMNAGFGDLTAFYGAMSLATGDGDWIPWLESLTGGMGSGPWDAAQTYVQNSPVYFLDRVETPLIIQAGASDSAIVPFSDEVFVGLKRLNKDVTYLRYGGEGHVLTADTNLIDYWKRVIAFLDSRLKAGSVAAAASDSKGGSR